MKKFLILFLFFQATLYAQKPVFTTAKVKAATVYFNAAEISQTASVNLPAGNPRNCSQKCSQLGQRKFNTNWDITYINCTVCTIHRQLYF
jgi:hypothetical protein